MEVSLLNNHGHNPWSNNYDHHESGSPDANYWTCPCTGKHAISQMKNEEELKAAFYPHFSLFQCPCTEEKCSVEDTTWSPPGNYMRLEVIGQGAFGTVYKCYDHNADRQFVLKKTKKSATNSEIARNEIDTLKCLKHPNIIEYYGSFVGKNSISVHLEYLPGGSLLQKITKSGPIPEGNAMKYLPQIIEGLEYIHSQGIVHMDLKCDNILLDENENAKIADFGSAVKKSFHGDSEFFCPSDAQCGVSLYWSSPEILNHEEFDQSTDIWSLGCLIVEMLTSSPPFWDLFETEFLASVEARILNYDPYKLIPNASAAMKLFLSFLLEHDRKKRLPNGSEARSKLKQIFSLYLACFYHRLFGFQDESYI